MFQSKQHAPAECDLCRIATDNALRMGGDLEFVVYKVHMNTAPFVLIAFE
jgi:hypothetical protein